MSSSSFWENEERGGGEKCQQQEAVPRTALLCSSSPRCLPVGAQSTPAAAPDFLEDWGRRASFLIKVLLPLLI